MRRIVVLLRALVTTGLIVVAPAAASQIAGVTLPDALDVHGQHLVLNGVGVRTKAVFKVYVGGLYLLAPAHDGAAIVASRTARALRMHFVRDVAKEKLVETFREGFERNAPREAAAAKDSVERFLGLVPDVREDGELTYVYVPGEGTVVYDGARELATIAGDDFATALFLVYLGPEPPTAELKAGLLGLAP